MTNQQQDPYQANRSLAALKEATAAKELETEMQEMARAWLKAHPDYLDWDEPFAEAIADLMEVLSK